MKPIAVLLWIVLAMTPVPARASTPVMEDGGTVELLPGAIPHGAPAAQVRAFIWRHWHDRQLGRISATTSTYEGVAGQYFFEIRPNDDGSWCVFGRHHSDRPSISTAEATKTWVSCQVKRRTRLSLDDSAVVGDDVVVEGDGYVLTFVVGGCPGCVKWF